MISAKEAYEQMQKSKNDTIEKQLREVEVYIREAANSGESKAYYCKPLRNSIIKELKKNGYKVEKKLAEFNEIYHVISWEINNEENNF